MERVVGALLASMATAEVVAKAAGVARNWRGETEVVVVRVRKLVANVDHMLVDLHNKQCSSRHHLLVS